MSSAPRRPLRGFSRKQQVYRIRKEQCIWTIRSTYPANWPERSARGEGLYTVFSAHCPLRPGLHRLWLFGSGGRCYLGVLSPRGGELTLSRRLSNRSRAALPRELRYAADRPMEKPGQAPKEDAQPPRRETSPAQPEQPGAIAWSERADGILTARDGDHELLALPVRPSAAAAEKIHVINGREYLVFRR